VLSELGTKLGWTEQPAEGDAPSWNVSDGSRISFEPGGQIEFSTAPYSSASEAIDAATALVTSASDAMNGSGIELLAKGVDPYSLIEAVPLQRHGQRYTRMTRFFNSIGSAGVQMMRQTAALQLNLERGPKPVERWKLLNALVPVVVALFANSRDYAGAASGYQSYRAHLWRTLDPTRTGIVGNGGDPVSDYGRFALDALAMRSGDERTSYRSFRDWMKVGTVGDDEWLFHLSTLFPEVRAKEYFELRSADTVDVASLAAPVVFVTGIVYDDESAEAAANILPKPDADLLEVSGRLGLGDSRIRELSASVVELALGGAVRLGADYVSPAHIAVAREFFTRVLRR
jgi:glutamate--cysteine ligase